MEKQQKILRSPAHYFPPRGGRYEVSPGLQRLGASFGNGEADAYLFQFDSEFPRYRENKLAARAERHGKYSLQERPLHTPVLEAATRLMARRLYTEQPDIFSWQSDINALFCRLTGEELSMDGQTVTQGNSVVSPPYVNLFDALCCQVQEDVAIVRRTGEGGDVLTALHVCAPSRWAPEEKIGRSFGAVHAPIPHFEKVAAAAAPLQARVMERGPLVRFTWGIEFDDRLNLHPETPSGISDRREFDPHVPVPFYLRVERQVLWGLAPEADAYLFTIRVYLYPATELSTGEREALAAALQSMSPASRDYKGLTGQVDALYRWLTAPPDAGD